MRAIFPDSDPDDGTVGSDPGASAYRFLGPACPVTQFNRCADFVILAGIAEMMDRVEYSSWAVGTSGNFTSALDADPAPR